MPALRTQLETTVTAAIKAKLTYLRAVEPYNGEMGVAQDKLDEAFHLLAGRAPAVLVASTDSKADTENLQRTRVLKSVNLDLFLVSNNLRSREQRTRGDNEIHQIAEDLEKLLIGRDVGVNGIGVLELVSETPMVHRPDICVWQVRYVVPMLAVATNPEDADPSLLELVGNIFQPPDDETLVSVKRTLEV